MTDDQFSKAFKDIVPESPTPDGWADGAKRKRRRRTGALAGVAGVVAVALAVPIGIQLSTPNIVATPAEQPSGDGSDPQPAPNGLLGAAACFDEDGQPLQVTETDEALEPGAVRAWLCGDAIDSVLFGTVGPLEPLVDGVDSLVEFIGSQPELPADIGCTMEYTLAYRVVFEYADGTLRPVAGELHGCRTVNDGTVVREGGDELYDLARSLWRDQRDATEAVDPVLVLPPCPLSQVMLVPTLDDITGAVICLPGPDQFSYEQVELHPDDVAMLVEDIRAGAVRGEPDGWENAGLGLMSAWGEWLTLTSTADGTGYWFADPDGQAWIWTPSPVSAEILALAIDGAPVRTPDQGQVDPVDPPVVTDEPALEPTFEPEGCLGIQSGALAAVTFGAVLDDGPTNVWLCGKGLDPMGAVPAGPVEPLTGEAAQTAVDLYNALPEPDPMMPCTEEMGPSYFVVHEYGDGVLVPVEIQDYGCRIVAAGDDLKGEGREYLADLVSLWTEQREATGSTGERPGRVCRATPSIIPVDHTAGFVAGWACPDVFGFGGEELLNVVLSPELVQAVSDALATSAYPLGEVHGDPTADGLVLHDQHGDPLLLNLMADGTYQWWDGNRAMAWEPPSAIAVQLTDALGN